MTQEQLKLKFILTTERFGHGGAKYILDPIATIKLNMKYGTDKNADCIWLVGTTADGSSTIEERSSYCAQLKEKIERIVPVKMEPVKKPVEKEKPATRMVITKEPKKPVEKPAVKKVVIKQPVKITAKKPPKK